MEQTITIPYRFDYSYGVITLYLRRFFEQCNQKDVKRLIKIINHSTFPHFPISETIVSFIDANKTEIAKYRKGENASEHLDKFREMILSSVF